MDGTELTSGPLAELLKQGPVVVLALAALYYTRKDLAEEKADNKEMLNKVMAMHDATLTVIKANTEANVKLAEKIDGLQAT